MADDNKNRRARKPGRDFNDVVAGINAQAGAGQNIPIDNPSPALPDTQNYMRTRAQMDRIRNLMPRVNVDSPANQRTLQIIQNIRDSIAARNASREGMGLREDVTAEMREELANLRDPVIANTEGRSSPRSLRRSNKIVVVNGEPIELPEDYRERKKFRKYRLEEMQRIGRRRREDRKTKRQLQGKLGRIGYDVGRDVGRVRAALPDIPMPTARNPLVRFGLRYGKNIGGVRGGLAGLGALAGGALIGKAIQAFGEDREAEAQRQEMLRRQARQDMLDMLGRKEQKRALQMSIDDNLAKLQAQAPDLYMRVASGRLLPQGAVVIGGVPRQDLLNQLGMAMSNGQFSE